MLHLFFLLLEIVADHSIYLKITTQILTMNYYEIKKLDEESLKHLKEGSGPVDECICGLLSEADEKRSIKSSIKKAFAKVKEGTRNRLASPDRGRRRSPSPQGYPGLTGHKLGSPSPANEINIPLNIGGVIGQGGRQSTREMVKRKGSCGKCGCDKEDFYLKHSYANIRITTPDISSLCPCPNSDCMPDKQNLKNNIKVTVERLTIEPQRINLDTNDITQDTISELSEMSERSEISQQSELLESNENQTAASLIKTQYVTEEDSVK